MAQHRAWARMSLSPFSHRLERRSSGGTPFDDWTGVMRRIARAARPTPEEHQLVRQLRPLALGHQLHQLPFDLVRLVLPSERQALAGASHVRVDEDAVVR